MPLATCVASCASHKYVGGVAERLHTDAVWRAQPGTPGRPRLSGPAKRCGATSVGAKDDVEATPRTPHQSAPQGHWPRRIAVDPLGKLPRGDERPLRREPRAGAATLGRATPGEKLRWTATALADFCGAGPPPEGLPLRNGGAVLLKTDGHGGLVTRGDPGPQRAGQLGEWLSADIDPCVGMA